MPINQTKRIKTGKRINPKLIYEYLRSENVFHYTPIVWDIELENTDRKLEITTGITDTDIVKEYLADKKCDEGLFTYINDVIKRCEAKIV